MSRKWQRRFGGRVRRRWGGGVSLVHHGTPLDAAATDLHLSDAEMVPYKDPTLGWIRLYGIRIFPGATFDVNAYMRDLAGVVNYSQLVVVDGADFGITVASFQTETDGVTQVATARIRIVADADAEGIHLVTMHCGTVTHTWRVIVVRPDPTAGHPTTMTRFECPTPSSDQPVVLLANEVAARAALAAPVRGTVYQIPAAANWTVQNPGIPIGVPTGTGKGWTYLMGQNIGSLDSSTRRLTSGEMAALPTLSQPTVNACAFHANPGTHYTWVRGLNLKSDSPSTCYGVVEISDWGSANPARHFHMSQCVVRGKPLRTPTMTGALTGAPVIVGGTTEVTFAGTWSGSLGTQSYLRIRRANQGTNDGLNAVRPFVKLAGQGDDYPLGRFAINTMVDNGNGTVKAVVAGQIHAADITTNTEVVEIWAAWDTAHSHHKGVVGAAEHFSINYCAFRDIASNFNITADGHCVIFTTGKGPYRIRGNDMTTPITIPWQFGGSAISDPTQAPADIHAELNYASRMGYPPTVAGGFYTHKCLCELKVSRRSVFERNTLDWSHPTGDDSQFGFAVNYKTQPYGIRSAVSPYPITQSAYPEMTVKDAIFRWNLVSRATGLAEVSGVQPAETYQDGSPFISPDGTTRVSIHDNLCMASLASPTTQGTFVKSGGAMSAATRLKQLTVRFNTHFSGASASSCWFVGSAGGGTPPVTEDQVAVGNAVRGYTAYNIVYIGDSTAGAGSDALALSTYTIRPITRGNGWYSIATNTSPALALDNVYTDPVASGHFAGNVLTSSNPQDYKYVASTAVVPLVFDPTTGDTRQRGADVDGVVCHTTL